MFTPAYVANFKVSEKQGLVMIENGMPLEGLEAIRDTLTRFCVERRIENEQLEAQRLKDEEADKKPELEEAKKGEEITDEVEVIVDEEEKPTEE